jgi:hypothetical protein
MFAGGHRGGRCDGNPSRSTTPMNVWLKRAGYAIGAIIALLLIVVSFVYG